MKIKELLQKVVSKERAQLLVTRYSVPLGILVVLTLWANYFVLFGAAHCSEQALATITMSLCFGLFWAVAQQMSEYRMRKDENGQLLPKPIQLQVAGQAIVVVVSALLCYVIIDLGISTILGYCSALTALIIAAFLLPFWKHKSDYHLVRWNIDAALTSMACLLVAGIAIGLICALLAGIAELFEVRISDNVYAVCSVTLAFLIGGGLMLFLLPDAEKTNKISQIGGQFCDKIGKFLLLPITCLYLLVLYAYLLKIIFTWELPNGGVAWMTTAMMGLVFITLFLRYKTCYTEEDTKATRFVRMGLPLATLPCLLLMTVGFVRRIHDYGWTPTRGYLCAVILWFFIAVALLLWADWQKRKGQTPRVISLLIISFSLLFVVTSIVPKANIYTICKAVQHEDTEQVAPAPSWSDTHKNIFLLEDNGEDCCAIPEGYSSFQQISSYADQSESIKPTRDSKGRLLLQVRIEGQNYTLHFDDKQKGNYADLYTEDGRLIRATRLTVTEYKEEVYIQYMFGYIFEAK